MDSAVLIVVEIEEVHDAPLFSAYQAEARAQIVARGGTVVARGGSNLEGRGGGTFLIQRWPSEAAFRDWQTSAEYQPLHARRQAAARLRISAVPLV